MKKVVRETLKHTEKYASHQQKIAMTSIKAMCERFSDRQFKEGCDIFAVQWNNIHATAQAGDIRGLRYFLDDLKMSPDERNERGDTPLNIAAYAGQTAAVEELLRHGANVNATNNKGWTPALSAASADHGDVMLLLHKAGADFSIRDMGGSTVAHMAASTNSDQSLRAIYSCFGEPGVLSTQTHSGATPAHVAAVFDNAEALKILYELGAVIDKQDNMVRVTAEPLRRGGDVKLQYAPHSLCGGETPAHKAARSHHVKSLEFLQAVGVDMNIPNDEEDTPSHVALWAGRFER